MSHSQRNYLGIDDICQRLPHPKEPMTGFPSIFRSTKVWPMCLFRFLRLIRPFRLTDHLRPLIEASAEVVHAAGSSCRRCWPDWRWNLEICGAAPDPPWAAPTWLRLQSNKKHRHRAPAHTNIVTFLRSWAADWKAGRVVLADSTAKSPANDLRD